MDNNLSKISVIINCYNGEKYLRECITSVVNQTYPNIEIIIWDNQSNDSSYEIIKSFRDIRIKYFLAENHTVLYEARNLALRKCKGEYIAFIDVDDIWKEDKLHNQVKCFADKDVAIACTNYFILNEAKNKKRKAFRRSKPSGNLANYLLKDYFVVLSSLMVRSNILFEDDNLFNPNYLIVGDFDFVLRIARKYRLSYIDDANVIIRIHNSNLSKDYEKSFYEIEDMIERYSIDWEEQSLKLLRQYFYSLKSKALISNCKKEESKKYLDLLPISIDKLKLMMLYILPKRIIKLIY